MSRNQLLARLHCIKRDNGWSDDEYRDILQARTGARSGADLDDAALARAVAALGAQKPPQRPEREDEWKWVNQVAGEKQGFLWKIRRVCINLGIRRGQQVAYAEGVASRIAGHERHLRMMTADELWLLIGPLERTARYKGRGEANG